MHLNNKKQQLAKTLTLKMESCESASAMNEADPMVTETELEAVEKSSLSEPAVGCLQVGPAVWMPAESRPRPRVQSGSSVARGALLAQRIL